MYHKVLNLTTKKIDIVTSEVKNRRENYTRIQRAKSYSAFRALWEKYDALIDYGMIEIEKNLDMEMINGLLLSDASMQKIRNRHLNSAFALQQRIQNLDLINTVINHFIDIGIKYTYGELDHRAKSQITKTKTYFYKASTSCYVVSKSNKIFTKLRNKWYPQGTKIIPNDVNLTPKTIAYWFMGDGTCVWDKQRKERSWISFATDSFTIENCEFLLKQLHDIGFKEAHIRIGKNGMGNLKPRIFIEKTRTVYHFLKMIEPFMLPCFDYKLKFPNIETLHPKVELAAEIRYQMKRNKKLKEVKI